MHACHQPDGFLCAFIPWVPLLSVVRKDLLGSVERAWGVLPCTSGKRCTCTAFCGGCSSEVVRYASSVLLGGDALRVRKPALLLRAARLGGTSDAFTPSAWARTSGGVNLNLHAQYALLFRAWETPMH